jgi:branched-chain amino acid transport system substrate-binding protein
VALIYVNNDFGKGGRDALKKALAAGREGGGRHLHRPGQVDFSAAGAAAKQSNADVVFVYTNEEESARAAARVAQAGLDQADRRRDHAGRPEGDRAGRRRGQRRHRATWA